MSRLYTFEIVLSSAVSTISEKYVRPTVNTAIVLIQVLLSSFILSHIRLLALITNRSYSSYYHFSFRRFFIHVLFIIDTTHTVVIR